MAAGIDQELGGRGAREQQITILARVHTVAETSYGVIDEVFETQLSGGMGETIEWKGAEGQKDLLSKKDGKITREITEPNPFWETLRRSSLIALGISLPALFGLAVLYWRRRSKLIPLEKDLQRNMKKYGELISEATDFPPARKGENVIRVSSLEALANISNNSLKSILLKTQPDVHIYYVIDGLVRYEYVSKLL